MKESEVLLREAIPLDSVELNQFFSSIPTQGFLEIKTRRQVDFFSLFHRLKLPFKTFLLEKKAQEILGTASFMFTKKCVQKQVVQIAYACDLRISSQRQAILNWAQHFLPLLQKIKNTQQVQHFLTSLNLTENQVINAFIRPKNRKQSRPVYELIQKYSLVTIHGFYPFSFKPNPFVSIDHYKKTDREELIRYIQNKLNNLDLVSTDIKDDLENFINESLLYSWSQFQIARNQENKIVGCLYPLSSSLLQDYFPQNYNSQANNFRQFLKVFSLLGLSRKLTKPFSSSNKQESLHFKMLHFFFFDHPDIMKNLIQTAFKNSKNNEFLIYAYQPENFQMRPPIGTIHTEIPYALYEIHEPFFEPESSIKNSIQKFIFLDGMWF